MKVGEMLQAEWKAIFKDRQILAILLLVPVLYMFLFGSLYSYNKVRQIPLVYVDEDNSQLSQQIVQAFSANETFEVMGSVASENDLVHAVQTGQAEVGLILPSDLEQKVTQGKQGQLLAIIDGTNMIIANTVLNNANEIVQTLSGGITVKRLEAQGVAPNQAFSLGFGYRLLFNPGLSYNIFLPLGLLGTVVQQVMFLGIALCVTREKEAGLWDQYLSHWRTPWKVFFAKTLPYFFFGIFDLLVTLGILKNDFSIPFLGQLGDLMLLSIVFVLSLLGIGFLASLFAPTKVWATEVTMLVAVPSFLLSGFTWPISAMPPWVAVIAKCLPLTYYLHGLREISLKGNGWEQIQGDVYILVFMAALTIFMSLLSLAFIGWKKQNTSSSHSSATTQQVPLS